MSTSKLDQQIAESKGLVAEEGAAKKRHEEELAEINKRKQFLIRDKIAEVLTLVKELGFTEIEDIRGHTVLSLHDTDIGDLVGR